MIVLSIYSMNNSYTGMSITPPSPPDNHTIIYNKITQLLNTESSRCLDNTELVQYFTSTHILQDENLIIYLREKDDIFDSIYNKHYVRGTIDFIMMNKLESMCQCWLMYLYH